MTENGSQNSRSGDLASIAIATCGVGYLPIAPGTWGSIVGVAIYIGVVFSESKLGSYLLQNSWAAKSVEAWIWAANLVLILIVALLAIWASGRAGEVWGEKDPSRAVADEVVGQLIVFLFVPFTTSWWLIGAGFLLFRLFDIFKPYPVNSLQDLPGGLGICADDVLAGIYAGIVLSVIYSISLSF